MLIAKNIELLEKNIASWKAEGLIIGFVPTMGALHPGHLSLVKQALLDCDRVVCSIFVNPTQFNDPSDLDNYPVQTSADLTVLKKAHCDLVFLPQKETMYPEGELTQAYDLKGLDLVMEGAHRPGHFDGVCTIVSKLFERVQPHKAYFGQKDYQQLAVIRQLTNNLSLSIDIVGCPIIRETDGLAMSSRNVLLTKDQRTIAPLIYQTLQEAQKRYATNSIDTVEQWIAERLNKTTAFRLDYASIVHAQTLQKTTSKKQVNVLCVAVYLGSVRLIDNILLNN